MTDTVNAYVKLNLDKRQEEYYILLVCVIYNVNLINVGCPSKNADFSYEYRFVYLTVEVNVMVLFYWGQHQSYTFKNLYN